jgi:hypothetical protein
MSWFLKGLIIWIALSVILVCIMNITIATVAYMRERRLR